MHIARVGERLPRLQIQFRISRSFRPRNLANLGSKIRFWIRRKEHTLKVPREHFVQGIRFQKHVVTLQARTTCAEVVTQIFIITLLSVTPEPSVLNTEYVFIKSAC